MAAKKPKTPPALSDMAKAQLGAAVAAFLDWTASPFQVAKNQATELIAYPGGSLLEFNPPDGPQETPTNCRASAAGVKMWESFNPGQQAQSTAQPEQQTQAAETETSGESEFVVEDSIPIPQLKRGGRGGTAKKYPFAAMGIGASFFIPQTADNPKPAKRIASVVSNATKTLEPKRFKVQAVNENPGRGLGARIWRVVDFTPAELAQRRAEAAAAAQKA